MNHKIGRDHVTSAPSNSGKTDDSVWSVAWPTRSPDLSHVKFYFWGYLKEIIYQNISQTVTELKETIGKEISIIGSEVRKHIIDIM